MLRREIFRVDGSDGFVRKAIIGEIERVAFIYENPAVGTFAELFEQVFDQRVILAQETGQTSTIFYALEESSKDENGSSTGSTNPVPVAGDVVFEVSDGNANQVTTCVIWLKTES